MKKTTLMLFLLISVMSVYAQSSDEIAVKKHLNSYKQAIEKLDTVGIVNLFVKNSKVIEQSKVEGTISNYLQHHLGPELKEFKSFTFSDYNVDVKVVGEYAFSTETYFYTIVLAKDGKELKSKGVATAILKKTMEGWKIEKIHSSYKKLN